MQNDRRSMMLSGLGLSVLGGASAASAAGKTGGLDADLEHRLRKALAELEVQKVMNSYESHLSAGDLQGALNLFALSEPDVQADVGFGFYYGPASVKRLIAGLHTMLELDDKGKLRNGALYLLANTTGIVEVADDLKTAKGHWLCPAISTPGSPEKGFDAMEGYAHRVADFIQVDGQWKLWHYMVHGILYYPSNKGWTDPAVYEKETKAQDLSWIPPQYKPDAPSLPGVGKEGAWRPDRPPTTVRLPEPYKTFSQTFSYARR